MINYNIWDGVGSIVREFELCENYEKFILTTKKYFCELNWIIKTLNEADDNIVRSIGYIEEIRSLNEGVQDSIIDLLRCADRSVRQYSVPINKFLDDVENMLLNDEILIDMVIFTSFKNLVINDDQNNLYILK